LLNKKGISPLIATVLIIGFTIIIAVLVITWINNLVGGQTDIQQCQADAGAKCSDYYNLLTFALPPAGITQVASGVEVPADGSHPEVVVTYLDVAESSLAVKTICGTNVEDGCDGWYDANGLAAITANYPAETVKAKFLIRASSDYKGEECTVACGEGTEVFVT